MWLFGTSKESDQSEIEGTIDDDSTKVGELLDDLIEKLKNSHLSHSALTEKWWSLTFATWVLWELWSFMLREKASFLPA